MGNGIATDSEGNVLVTGIFTGMADFDRVELTSVGTRDIFVAKYAPDGPLLWAKRAGGTTGRDSPYDRTESAHSVAADSAGNVLVTGFFSGTADFDGTRLTSPKFF
jgi:hypothetical protein